MAELGRQPSSVHRAIYRRLDAMIIASDTPEEISLPPGRAGPEFIARLFDLEGFAANHGFMKSDPYMDEGQVANGLPTKISSRETFAPDNPISPFNPYRSLDASRLKLTGTGLWPIEEFLENELWLPYCEPKILQLPDRRAEGPNFKAESFEQNLALARLWDSRGLLALFHEAPRFQCRVFNAHKSEVIDRQIGDRRWQNQHEMHPKGPSARLPNGCSVTSIHCPKGKCLRGCISDRKDFYHQCAASLERAHTNCLPFSFEPSLFKDSPAFQKLLEEIGEPTSREKHGDRYHMSKRPILHEDDLSVLYAGFKSLFQGDHLGVEYALAGHKSLLESGGLGSDCIIERGAPFPLTDEYQGLVIDDFFSISAQAPGLPLSQAKCCRTLLRAEEIYREHKVLGSDEKTIRGDRRFKVIGAEVASDEKTQSAGLVTVGAPVQRRCALAALSLRVARLPIISRDLASRVAGSWISTLMFRRPLTCLLHHAFALGPKTTSDGREVVGLSRRVAEEFALASLFSLIAVTDVSVKYEKRVFATDASMTRGAVVAREVPLDIAKLLWAGGDRKGGCTKLDNEFKAILRAVGEDDDAHPEDLHLDSRTATSKPAPVIDFAFDFVEICGGSGVLSKAAARRGLIVCAPIDISSSRFFDLRDTKLVNWIFDMIAQGRFRALCLEPPCTTFSPAQHPASRGYDCPLGYNRLDPKTFLGNILAFRCLAILWFALRYDCPSLLEQPRLSKMAWLQIWRFLLGLGCKEAIVASCQFGSPHRKEFRFLGHGLDFEALDTRCRGGHTHVRIEGAYTKNSAIYTEGLADHLARLFDEAISAKHKRDSDAPRVSGLESVVLNDILSTGEWTLSHAWAWRFPSHINIFESYSLVSLLKKLTAEGGDCRFSALLDSRVAKGAHSKGRSSSNALRLSLQKAGSYILAGNLHPSYGFAPTRLNVADAPTRDRELPASADASLLDILDFSRLAHLHSLQFSKAAAGWIWLTILAASCFCPVGGVGLSPRDAQFQGAATFLLAHVCIGFIAVTFLTALPRLHLKSSPRLLLLGAWTLCLGCCGVSSCFHNDTSALSLSFTYLGAAAMPINPGGPEDVKRAQRRAGNVLQPDRVVLQRTRSNRNALLESFGT